MNITHLADVECKYYSPSALAMCRSIPVLVTALNDSDIALWSATGARNVQPLAVLSGHHKLPVIHFCISRDSKWLFSVSNDTRLLWEIDQCISNNSGQGGAIIPRSQSTSTPADIGSGKSHIVTCFSDSSTRLFVSSGGGACLINTMDGRSSMVDLSIDSCWSILSASFVYNSSSVAIIGLENRTFKIIDFDSNRIVYQSYVYPALFTTVQCTTDYIVMGTNDGTVTVFNAAQGLLIGRSSDSMVHCIKESHDQESHDQSSYDGVDIEYNSQAVMGLYVIQTVLPDNESSWLSGDIFLIIAIKGCGLVVINGYNKEVLGKLTINDPISSLVNPKQPTITIPTIHNGSIVQLAHNEFMCSLCGPFNGSIMLLKVCLNLQTSGDLDLSVVSSSPILASSILKIPSINASSKVTRDSTSHHKAKKKTTGVKDQPLTFKNKVKSSGYTQQPRTTMFKPQTNTTTPVKVASTLSGTTFTKHVPSAPTAAGIPNIGVAKNCSYDNISLSQTFTLSEKQPIRNCLFTGNGSSLLYSARRTLFTMKPCKSTTPLSRHLPLNGHDGDITCVSCSHDNQLVLTCSNDRTAKVWRVDPCNQQPLLNIHTVVHNYKETATTMATKKENTEFPCSINHCSFYYLDKYILLGYSNRISVMKYHIDADKVHDIKRYLTKSHYKRVSLVPLDSTVKSVTALSCINDFYSYLIYVAGSDRSLHIYDMNEMKWVWSVDNAHKRPINCIAQNKGSKFIPIPSSVSHDLFATSSIGDGLKLWDTRTQRCVRWYSSHNNPSQPVSASFSPCGQYIATGSEDQAVYIYDIRNLAPVNKLVCKTGIVSTVHYHPYKAVIACGTLEGELNFFETT